jgi:hypothetical protein
MCFCYATMTWIFVCSYSLTRLNLSLSLSLSLTHTHTHTCKHIMYIQYIYMYIYTHTHTYTHFFYKTEGSKEWCLYQETEISISFTKSDLLVLLYLQYGWPIINELTSGPVSSCCSNIECLCVPRSHTSITLLSCSPVRDDLCNPVKRTATNSHYITKLSLTLQLSSKQYGIVENKCFWLFNLSSNWIMFSVIRGEVRK